MTALMTRKKTKRGRPSKVTFSDVLGMQTWCPLGVSRRGSLNKHYELRALKVVQGMQEKHILAAGILGEYRSIKWGILRELGRYSPDAIQKIVPLLAHLMIYAEVKDRGRFFHWQTWGVEPNVRAWAEQLRTFRLKETAGKPDSRRLTKHLQAQIDSFSETVSENDEYLAAIIVGIEETVGSAYDRGIGSW